MIRVNFEALRQINMSSSDVLHNKALQLTQKASFVLCITLRSIVAQNKGHFLGI